MKSGSIHVSCVYEHDWYSKESGVYQAYFCLTTLVIFCREERGHRGAVQRDRAADSLSEYMECHMDKERDKEWDRENSGRIQLVTIDNLNQYIQLSISPHLIN